MRVLCETQGTPEWFAAKRGRMGGSDAKRALMGRHTKGRRKVIERLADDIDGVPDFSEEELEPWFVDGLYYESWARGWYSFKYGVDVVQTGFVVHDDYDHIGCSPDGLVGDDGLIEIKYRKSLGAFKKHAALRANAQVMAQVQMQMFVTGRAWCDYVNYWRSDDHGEGLEKGFCERIERDQAYIDNTLLPAILAFWQDIQTELDARKRHRETRARL